MALIDALFARSRATLAALAILLVAGAIALHETPKEAEPDIEVPLLHVSVSHPGITPGDADRRLVRPLVRELRNLEGLEDIRSSAYSGGATLSLEYDEDFHFDAQNAMARVRERLDAVRDNLPDDAGQPLVHEVNVGLLPLLVVNLSGRLGERELIAYARALSDELLQLDSVLSVDIFGERDETLEVIVDPLVLASYDLDVGTLLAAVKRSNQLVPTGGIDTPRGRLELTFTGLFSTLRDVLSLPIKSSEDSVVRLGDIATVSPALSDRASIARLNGEPAVAIAITKRIGSNVFEALEDIRDRVADVSRSWPAELKTSYSQDRSWRIRTRIGELRNSLVSAVVLVMAIVVAMLGFRSGLLVGVAIPGSFLLAVLGLGLFGLSINTAVLYAFVMSVGLLVDGAIVMVESADRAIEEGTAPLEAYRRSVKTLYAPIVSSTATTLAAFLPLVFWPGLVGEYLKFLPLTILLTLSGSLLMALVFIPVLGAAFAGKSHNAPVSKKQPAPLTRGYLALLRVGLERPAWVVGGAIFVLIWSMWLYERYGLTSEFLPDIEPSSAAIFLRAPGDRSLAQKESLALEAEAIVSRYQAFESIFTRIGRQPGANMPGSGSGDVIASILVEFRDWHEHAPANQVLDMLEGELNGLPGLDVEVRRLGAGPIRDKPIDIDVIAPSAPLLAKAVTEVRQFVDAHPSLKGAEDSRPARGIEWQLSVDRGEAARYGIDVASTGQYARFVTRGLKLGSLAPGSTNEIDVLPVSLHQDETDIQMRFPARYRNVEGLRAIRLQTAQGAVPLSHFASLEPVTRAGKIERLNGQLSRRVKADIVRDAVDGDVVRDVKAWVNGASFTGGASAQIKGEDEDREEAREFLMRAFAAALFIMALILVAQFNSFYSAFLILFAVVLSTVGVRLGLLIIDMPFGLIMSGIGVIALAGIVVNNNIILIDSYNRYRRAGMEATEALLRTGETRLRPVLLTTLTTIAGLMPLVLQVDIDFEDRAVAFGAPGTVYWVQMSSAVVFGLAFATLLTLFVTPAALMLRERISSARAREAQLGTSESIRGAFDRHGPAVGVAALSAIFAAWFFIPEIITVRIIDIFSKQIFEQPPSRWFQALESASFWSLIILSAAYAYWRNDHVRIDLIRERLSERGRAVVEVLGFVFLLGPVCLVIVVGGWEFVMVAFADDEISGALLGSPTNWIFKIMMVLCFAQLLAIGVFVTWKNLRFLGGRESHVFPPERGGHGQHGVDG